MSTKLLFGLAALLAPVIAEASTTDPDNPNILLILLDDVAVDKIGAYAGDFPTYAPVNRPSTPNIDTLATRGIRFQRAWATPYCSSTRLSIQTGKYPFKTGIGTALGENVPGFDPASITTPTLGTSFTDFGYETGMFGKWHLGFEDEAGNLTWLGNAAGPVALPAAPHPARLGWKRFFGHLGGYPGASPEADGYFRWQRVGWMGGFGTGHAAWEDNNVHMTDRTVEVAVDWITSRNDPFLAFVALNAGHSGKNANGPWQGDDASGDAGDYYTAALSCVAAGTCTEAQIYQALVEHADIAIGELLAGIPQDTLDNTIIIFMGDNGTPYRISEDDFHVSGRGKGSTWENGVHVPLIVTEGIAWRTGVAGPLIPYINHLVDAKVNLLDVYNTAHNIAFGANIIDVDSVSFTDCFTNNDIYCNRPDGRYGYTETFPLSGVANSSTQASVSWRYDTVQICYMPSTTAGAPATGCLKEHFYDVSTDPLQTNPLSWTGIRRQRLRDQFVLLHSGSGSWAEPGGAMLPWCGPAVVANCAGF